VAAIFGLQGRSYRLLDASGAELIFKIRLVGFVAHEAIGDTIVYGAMSTKHRQRMGFVTRRQHQDAPEFFCNFLVIHVSEK